MIQLDYLTAWLLQGLSMLLGFLAGFYLGRRGKR